MRAVVYDRYGERDVLRVAEVPEPAIGWGGALVRVTRAALNPKDSFTRKGRFRALSGRAFPKRIGMDFAGVVVESRTSRVAPGQRVFGFVAEVRYLRGTLADMVACHAREVCPIPSDVTDDDAAAMALVGSTALQAFRDVARLRAGERVLVNGGSGGVGVAAIQIARVMGAEVHTVSSAKNEPLCAELGAHKTWSYPEHGWKREAPFDVVLDAFGNLAFSEIAPHLAERGRYVSTVPSARRVVRDVTSRLARKEERLVVVRPRARDFATLAEWMRSGRLRAVIDARFALDRAVDAFERLESKRTRGKIIIQIRA